MDIVCCLLFNPYRLGLVNIKIPAQQRTGHSLTAWNAVKMANWEKLQNVMDWTDALSWRLPDCSHVPTRLVRSCATLVSTWSCAVVYFWFVFNSSIIRWSLINSNLPRQIETNVDHQILPRQNETNFYQHNCDERYSANSLGEYSPTVIREYIRIC